MENLIFGDIKYALLNNLKIKKTAGGRDVSPHNAFSVGETVKFTVTSPRNIGVRAISLCICKDGCENQELNFDCCSDACEDDVFTLTLDLNKICAPDDNGLFFYCYKVWVGNLSFYSCSINNADFYFSQNRERDFCLLVHTKDYTTPAWAGSCTMYHIFVDRFYKASKKMPLRSDAKRNDDWENGIPEYAEYAGAHLENNEFFGGNLWGVAEKLDYLKDLGVTVIYLSPIFEAYSNHKYDTSNYMKVDRMFGGDEAFLRLISEARDRGIKIILDGVFNHTGDKSIYFDKEGKYGDTGAFNNPNSKYRDWYYFRPDNKYESWWGIEILPKLNLRCDSCKSYFTSQGGVIEKYLLDGIGGWRLDVADELTDEFLRELRATAKKTKQDALIIGEVWENAADKVAYNKRREYFRGRQLDSVMNYPFKNALIEYIKEGDSEILYNELTEIYASYPIQVSNVLMNLLGTHDTERILTVLSDDDPSGKSIHEIARSRLTDKQREDALKRLIVASTIQYTVYGFPSVFYGDEAGIEGYSDPFCRKPFPWHNINAELHRHYKKLGKIRAENAAFDSGSFEITVHRDGLIVYKRKKSKCEITVCANTGKNAETVMLDGVYIDLLSDRIYDGIITLESMSALVLKRK